jgi:hypothetical protein
MGIPADIKTVYDFDKPREGVFAYARRMAEDLDGPLRAPHHTVSLVGLLGEAIQAAGGVLLLDHAEEFKAGDLRLALRAIAQARPRVRPAVILYVHCLAQDERCDAIRGIVDGAQGLALGQRPLARLAEI